MGEQNDNLNYQNEDIDSRPKRTYLKFVLVFLVLIIAGLSYLVWSRNYSEEARLYRQNQENLDKYNKAMNELEAAMKADTYGGKTPEETLKMFIDALEKGDIDLASKYFMLETNTKSPDYLTRKKWEDGLKRAKEEGKLEEIVKILSNAKPDPEAAISEEYFVFSTRDQNNNVIADIDLYFNEYSKAWQIKSM